MAQTNYTPISLYYSATAASVPTAGNLVAGELALNTADGKLFYKDSSGVVQTLASKAGNVNVSSFSAGSTGLTPSTATTGAVTLAGTLNVSSGGTGLTTLTAGYIPYGNGTSAFSSSANLTFNGSKLDVTGDIVIPNYTNAYQIKDTGGTSRYIMYYSGSVSPSSGNDLFIGNTLNNAVAFFSNNTERMRINSSGNVIIGTTSSPFPKLYVSDGTVGIGLGPYATGSVAYAGTWTNHSLAFVTNGAEVGRFDIAGNLGLGVTPSAWVSGDTIFQIKSGTSYASLWGRNGSLRSIANAYYDGTNYKYASSSYAPASFQVENTGQFTWSTAPTGTAGNNVTFTQAMTLDASGNLGIGTTSPTANSKLTVSVNTTGATVPTDNLVVIVDSKDMALGDGGGIRFGGVFTTGGSVNPDMTYIKAYKENATSGNYSYALTFGTRANGGNPQEQMRLDSSGNLGIGTTSPAAALEISRTSANPTINLTAVSNGSPVINMTPAGSGVGAIQVAGAFPLTFYTNSSERMRIDSSGNLLVGTTTQFGSSKVTVSSGTIPVAAKVTGTSNQTIFGMYIIKPDNDTTTSQRFIGFGINNDASGSGQINANGANSAAFGSYSDIRLKENIVDLPSQINNILALKPKEFDYKTGGHQIGFIAQEMQEIYPDVVGQDETGMMTITGWSKTEARLVKAIQEQQALIESLTQRIATLENK